MKFNKKSGISMILSTAMIVSSVPATAFASENEPSAVSVEQTNDAEEETELEETTETEGATSEEETTEAEETATEETTSTEETDVISTENAEKVSAPVAFDMTPQNTVTVAVATVSENTYATVQEAVDAIENEGVIVLTADTTENIEIPKGKNIIINLNGNKIINKGGNFTGGAYVIKNDDYGVMEINDGNFNCEDSKTLTAAILNWNEETKEIIIIK